ncbi:MAG: HAD family hydrolase [Eubacteriaceae bacterium]
MIKMIVLDLDGTTLNENNQISEENVKAIKKCYQHGVKVTLASGRSEKAMRDFIIECDLEDLFHICNNGAYIFKTDGTRFNIPYIAYKEIEHIKKSLEELELPFVVCTADDFYYETSNELVQELITHGESPKNQVDDIIILTNVLKFIILCRTQEEYERAKVIENDKLNVFRTSHDFVEIMSKGINKYSAVKELAKIYGIENDEIMAMGDGENDVPMLSGVGLGVAVANAREETMSAAKIYSQWDNTEFAVAKEIEKYILSECYEY